MIPMNCGGGGGIPRQNQKPHPISRRTRDKDGAPESIDVALRLYDERFPALQGGTGSRYLDRTGGRARRNGRGEMSIGEHFEIRRAAVERDCLRPSQVRPQKGNGFAFLAGKQCRVYERRQAHIQAVNGAVVGAAAELGDTVEKAVGPLDWRGQRGHLQEVGAVVEAVEAGVGSAGGGVEQGAVVIGAAFGGRTVVVAVGGEEHASGGESAVSEVRAEAVEYGHGKAGRDLINGAFTVSAAILCGAVEVAIFSLDEWAERERSAGAAGKIVGIVQHAGRGNLDNGSTKICAALGNRDVKESVSALGGRGDRRIAVCHIKPIDFAEGAGTGDLVDKAAVVRSAAAGGAVEISVGCENWRAPGESSIDEGVKVVQDGVGARGRDLENDALALATALLRGAVEIAVGAEGEAAGGIGAVGGASRETVENFLLPAGSHAEDGAGDVFTAVVGGAVKAPVRALHQGYVPRVGSAGWAVGEIVNGRDRLGLREHRRA